jgi:hypothetical protein
MLFTRQADSAEPCPPLLYVPFDFFLAFFFITLFLAVGPLSQSKQWQHADERGVNRSWRRETTLRPRPGYIRPSARFRRRCLYARAAPAPRMAHSVGMRGSGAAAKGQQRKSSRCQHGLWPNRNPAVCCAHPLRSRNGRTYPPPKWPWGASTRSWLSLPRSSALRSHFAKSAAAA